MKKLLSLLLLGVAGCASALNAPAHKIAQGFHVYRQGAAACSTLTPAQAKSWNALGDDLESAATDLDEASR